MLLLTHFVGLGKSFPSAVENPGGKHCCVFVPGLGDYSEWRGGLGSYLRTVKIWVMAICVCVCVCVCGWVCVCGCVCVGVCARPCV